MTTGIAGIPRKGTYLVKNLRKVYKIVFNSSLTPTNYGHNDDVLYSQFCEHDYQLLKHQDSFSKHPHESDKKKIVDQYAYSDTGLLDIHY